MQFFIIGSSLNLSHASPHRLHASAHAVQIESENGPVRAVTQAAAAQMVAQSEHVCAVSKCSFFPLATIFMQCAVHASQTRPQSLQALAQSQKCWACPKSSLVAGLAFSSADFAEENVKMITMAAAANVRYVRIRQLLSGKVSGAESARRVESFANKMPSA
jgi:hypothetical protein